MHYQIRRSKRRTISIHISPRGEVIVSGPLSMTDAQVHQLLQDKASWIEKHLARVRVDVPLLSEQQIKALKCEAMEKVSARAQVYGQILGLKWNKISVRKQRTLWGSCTGNGNLSFNCLLALVPDAVLDYVVVHELCHLRHMNHSERFWKLVSSVLPEYAQARRWLKENGNDLINRLP